MNVVNLRPKEDVTVFLRPAFSITVQKGSLGAQAALGKAAVGGRSGR